MPTWLREFAPILGLLTIIGVVLARLPKVALGHSEAFLARRRMNWLPVGLTYAFLYMGRYNLNVCKTALGSRMSKEEFGTILFWGALTYGCSFVINGPLTDRVGGRRTIILSAVGSAAMNVAMGLLLFFEKDVPLVVPFSILYSLNMYFQSFGAVSIVKVNASWFHVRERGTFGAMFGILISLGVYFAFDWGQFISVHLPIPFVFFVPAAILIVFGILDFIFVRDTPGQAGFEDFDTADASSGDDGPRLPLLEVAARMFRNPIIVTIALVEFCSGYLRDSVMQWYRPFANETGTTGFVSHHWGMLTCAAGILGGAVAGIISDRVFQSRRGPVAAVLYGVLLVGTLALFAWIGSPIVGVLVVAMVMAVIGVHGVLSGTASMDFGGKKNAGVAVGIIDGFVYLGVAAEAKVLGWVLPRDAAAKALANWWTWPMVMAPVAVIGLILASRLWNAKPSPHAAH